MTLFQAFGQFAGAGAAAPAGTPGMVLMKPTSIAHTGTSATLGANGQVTFSAVTELNINGCFTADFDNYAIYMRHAGPNNADVRLFFRAAGTDETANAFTRQTLITNDTAVTSSRGSAIAFVSFTSAGSAAGNGSVVHLYGPFIAAPTSGTALTVSTLSTVRTFDNTFTHSQSTSYDGFTLESQTVDSMTGGITIYGLRS